MLPVTLIISIVVLYLIIKKPDFLTLNNPFEKAKSIKTIDDKYNHKKVVQQKEIDKLLDKINKKSV